MKSPEGHLLGTRRNKPEHSRQPQAHSYIQEIHGELDILAIEVGEAEDVFVHSFATL